MLRAIHTISFTTKNLCMQYIFYILDIWLLCYHSDSLKPPQVYFASVWVDSYRTIYSLTIPCRILTLIFITMYLNSSSFTVLLIVLCFGIMIWLLTISVIALFLMFILRHAFPLVCIYLLYLMCLCFQTFILLPNIVPSSVVIFDCFPRICYRELQLLLTYSLKVCLIVYDWHQTLVWSNICSLLINISFSCKLDCGFYPII